MSHQNKEQTFPVIQTSYAMLCSFLLLLTSEKKAPKLLTFLLPFGQIFKKMEWHTHHKSKLRKRCIVCYTCVQNKIIWISKIDKHISYSPNTNFLGKLHNIIFLHDNRFRKMQIYQYVIFQYKKRQESMSTQNFI